MEKLGRVQYPFAAYFQWIRKVGWLIFLLATACFFLLAIGYGRNGYGIYHPRILKWGLIGIPLIFAGIAVLGGKISVRKTSQVSIKDWAVLAGFSLGIAALLTWLFPPPLPAFSHPHTLRIVTTGTKNEASKGTDVEIKYLRALDGTPIQLNQFELSGNWRLVRDNLVSSGDQPSAVAELKSSFPVGVELRANFRPQAGQIVVQWDDTTYPIDLYSKWPAGGNLVFRSSPWATYSPVQKGFLVANSILYFLSIAALVFVFALIIQLRVFPSWLNELLILLICAFVLITYIGVKQAYANFNTERVYGDTITYVRTAQVPLWSRNFWFSDRTFTLPLLYKIAGMNLTNYRDNSMMQKVGDYQTWLSIASWTVLGLAVAGSMRKRWLAPVAFTVVLFFSLSFDISLWDRLMYSESLSFSLFALLLAFWIGLEQIKVRLRPSIFGSLTLFGMIVVSILYSFARDTNLYLLLTAVIVFSLALILKRTAVETRKYYLIYILAVLGLFIFQNMTIRLGNRWQIHIFDNLVRRVLVDEEALAYFQQKGLPVSQQLLDLKDKGVAEYQGLLERSNLPEFQAVRTWVNQSGQPTYIRYLLDHPQKSLLEPMFSYDKLINGNNLEYRYPIFPNQPVPAHLEESDRKFYLRSPVELIGILLLLILGLLMFWFGREKNHPAWVVLTVLVVSIVPLSFIIWNGNPLEIERHAVQIGIQFRLAGWMALLLLVDRLALGSVSRSLIPSLEVVHDHSL